MSHVTMTLIGLYNYNPTIFDLLTVPADLDKDTLVDNILQRSGQFEVMYPDDEYIKFSIGAWSRKWQKTFTRWTDALKLEYNPLENYDRQEDWTDNRDVSGNNTESTGSTDAGTTSTTTAGTASSNTTGSTDSTVTNKVSAYDASDFTNRDQNVTSGNDISSSSGNTNQTETGNTSMTRSGTSTGSHSLDDDLTHSGRIHGNIGVTTSQQMLLSELDLGYWNVYEKITDLFLTEFVIPVY